MRFLFVVGGVEVWVCIEERGADVVMVGREFER